MSASLEPSLSGESVNRFLSALPTPIITQSAAFATQDSNSTLRTSASLSMSSSPSAPPTPSSTESHAPATLESSSSLLTPVLPAPQEPSGTDRSATRSLPRPAPLAMSSTKTSTSASPQPLHAETMPSSTEPPASASLVTTLSTEFVSSALPEPSSTAPSVPRPKWSHRWP